MQQRLDRFFKIKEAPAIFNPFGQEALTYVPPPKKEVKLVNVLDSPSIATPTIPFTQIQQTQQAQQIQQAPVQKHEVQEVQDVPFTSLVPLLAKPKVQLFPSDEIIPMIQPMSKEGKRLLYKYPRLPKVGPRGSYDLLVGESDRSEAAWLIQFDGAANPNPGPASSGAVLWSPKDFDGKRNPVFESGKYIGKATNNIAEVQGLLLGLQIAAMRGARELLIEGDSELIIFQQTGRYRVSDKNLKVWWANIQAALMDETSFDWIAIKQVPREQNERADSITKEVLSKKQSFQRA
jgi:ribonuclease HI